MNNAVLPRFLKSAYRKDPITSILVTMGVVDGIIGGLNDRWSLFALGLAMAGISIALKWWRIQQQENLADESSVQHYLPPQSSSTSLPMLTTVKKQSPR